MNSGFGVSFYFFLPLAVQGNDVVLIEENEIFMTTITRKIGFKWQRELLKVNYSVPKNAILRL